MASWKLTPRMAEAKGAKSFAMADFVLKISA
jgi:hypothetical protein